MSGPRLWMRTFDGDTFADLMDGRGVVIALHIGHPAACPRGWASAAQIHEWRGGSGPPMFPVYTFNRWDPEGVYVSYFTGGRTHGFRLSSRQARRLREAGEVINQ